MTKNQMLRVEFSRNSNDQSNLGVGDYDLYDRAYEREQLNNEFRLSTSGPVGRKMRNEVRFEVDWDDSSSHSVSDAVTILRPGRAEQRRRAGRPAAAVEDDRVCRQPRLHARQEALAARRRARRGRLVSRRREPQLQRHLHLQRPRRLHRAASRCSSRSASAIRWSSTRPWQFGAYISDDIRVRKNLMISVGLRAEAQTHLGDNVNLAPRFNMTWSPFKSNRTTFRGGAGIFYDWYESSLYEQTLRLDGTRQVDVIIRNPGYPNPLEGGDARRSRCRRA